MLNASLKRDYASRAPQRFASEIVRSPRLKTRKNHFPHAFRRFF